MLCHPVLWLFQTQITATNGTKDVTGFRLVFFQVIDDLFEFLAPNLLLSLPAKPSLFPTLAGIRTNVGTGGI